MLASSKSRRINEEEEFLVELEEIKCDNENHIENAMIANIAQSVEIIVKSRDKQRVCEKGKS